MEKINIVLADDHILVRKGIKAMLESEEDLQVIGEAGNGREALEVAAQLHPDILVLDIRMPEMTGLEAAARLSEVSPGSKAMILSMHDSEEYVLQALDAGAYGYLLKDTDKTEFVKALHQIHAGNKYFSGAVSNAWRTGCLIRNLYQNPAETSITSPNESERFCAWLSTAHLTKKSLIPWEKVYVPWKRTGLIL
jgi:DNA-binding NarL/FixJ family response regulator